MYHYAHREHPAEALQRVTEFWAEVGMQTLTMDAS